MLSRSLLFPFVVVALALVGISEAGERISHTIDSQYLAGNLIGAPAAQQIQVVLPDGYDQNQADYPVIYWFPGNGQSATSGIELDQLDAEFSAGRASPSILVFMPGPTDFGSPVYLSSNAFGDWEGFFTNEVLPLVDDTYRTAEHRGTMGFSLGGINSLLLAIRQPGTFDAIGANDPAIGLISGAVRSRDQRPEGYIPPDTPPPTIEEFMARFPDTLEGYKDTFPTIGLFGQVGASLSPNLDQPSQGDIPYGLEGWIPEARANWAEYDLLDPDVVALHQEALSQLSHVSVVLPEEIQRTNHVWSRDMLANFNDIGMSTQSLLLPGAHSDNRFERFKALLSNVSYALNGESKATLGPTAYTEDFGALGTDDVSTKLPIGWSVSDGAAQVFRDRTNTQLNGGNVELIGEGPAILNVGQAGADDRGLGIALGETSDGAVIQFLADVAEIDANGLQLRFDIEAWDRMGAEPAVREAAFRVTAEFDLGDGFEQLIDFGVVTTGELLSSDQLLDGNVVANRVSFDSGDQLAPIRDAQEIRVRWTANPESTATQQWVFGIDDVELEFITIASQLAGDFNGDSLLNAIDIDMLSEAVREGVSDSQFDLTGDDLVNAADRDSWVEDVNGTLYGDLDLNGIVDFSDFVALSNNFALPGGWSEGDITGDGFVEFPDFLLLAQNFGEPGATANAVPEPTSQNGMIASALVLLLLRRRSSDSCNSQRCANAGV